MGNRDGLGCYARFSVTYKNCACPRTKLLRRASPQTINLMDFVNVHKNQIDKYPSTSMAPRNLHHMYRLTLFVMQTHKFHKEAQHVLGPGFFEGSTQSFFSPCGAERQMRQSIIIPDRCCQRNVQHLWLGAQSGAHSPLSKTHRTAPINRNVSMAVRPCSGRSPGIAQSGLCGSS